MEASEYKIPFTKGEWVVQTGNKLCAPPVPHPWAPQWDEPMLCPMALQTRRFHRSLFLRINHSASVQRGRREI